MLRHVATREVDLDRTGFEDDPSPATVAPEVVPDAGSLQFLPDNVGDLGRQDHLALVDSGILVPVDVPRSHVVPVVLLPEVPRGSRRPVAALDVVQTPLDLHV